MVLYLDKLYHLIYTEDTENLYNKNIKYIYIYIIK